MSSRMFDADILTVLQEGRGSPFSAEKNETLWAQVPEPMRLSHFTRQSVPGEHLSSFGYYHAKIGNIHLDVLPAAMQREIAYAIWRTVEGGGKVGVGPLGLLARELGETVRRMAGRANPCQSLMDRTPRQWQQELARTWVRRTGAIPNPSTLKTMAGPLCRFYKLVWFAYDDAPWWEREIWDLRLDARIPRRDHEPFANQAVHWHRVEPGWLRKAAMWHGKVLLETNQLSWSTSVARYVYLREFSDFVERRGNGSPLLVADVKELRPLMLTFFDDARTRLIGPSHQNKGKRRSDHSVGQVIATVDKLYRFLYDNREDAARLLCEPRWTELSPAHARFYSDGDLPRHRFSKVFDERHLVSDESLAKVNAHVHHLGAPVAEGGLGDPQAMRMLLLLIATGRRLSEIRMLDFHPLVPVTSAEAAEGIAKLHYQQTKIEGAPDTIFVGAEVVEVIAEQQRWLGEHMTSRGHSGVVPRYLFVRMQNNSFGIQPYTADRLRTRLWALVQRFDIRDESGELLPLGQTHRMRHTKATSLINAGVPLHVVQRYMGHTSPAMTMHYAQTLDATAKAEFLKYRKITGSGTTSTMSGDDLYDLMALENRTDRVLPNGWCSLPPTQSCSKGNACLTCELFVTDKRFRDVHATESVQLGALIEVRQRDHRQRTGHEMGEDHVWLKQRRLEQAALVQIVSAIDAEASAEQAGPVRGAGARARADADEAFTGGGR